MSSIVFVVGSLRTGSYNRKLAKALGKLLPMEYSPEFADIGDLPLYNQDQDDSVPETVQRFKKQISSASGVIFVTPEYNRSIPGVLKNALDQGSRPYGTSVWANKPAGIVGTSTGAIGTALAQQHLRTILAFLNMPTLNQPEAYIQFKEGLIDDDGVINNDSTKAYLQGWINAYIAWVKTNGK